MIRKASVADVGEIVGLETISHDQDHFGRRQFRYLLTKANAVTLVTLIRGKIIGACVIAFRKGSGVCRIYNLMVHPEHRRRGLGEGLLEEATKLSIKRGCRLIRLEVRQDNKAAISFYERYGFIRGEAIVDYYENGKAAWVYNSDTGSTSMMTRVAPIFFSSIYACNRSNM